MIHLHTHSYYSFLEGVASPAELADAAAKDGMSAIALTDHLWLTGAVEFYNACQDAGVSPILGLELDVILPADIAPPDQVSAAGRLVLLVENDAGWRSLCRLSSLALTDPEDPAGKALSIQELGANSSGLICLSGGVRGPLTRLVSRGFERAAGAYLTRLGQLFPGHLYVELQDHTPQDHIWNARLVSLAKRLDLPTVATQDIYYLDRDGAKLQRLQTAMRTNQPLNSLPPDAAAPDGACFTTSSQMAERFALYPEALAATDEIAGRCQFELPLGVPHYPKIELPDDQTPMTALRQKAERGARELYPDYPPEIRERLDHELEVIESLGYAPLFLVMEDIVAFTRQQDIPLSSRGSAASSLVAHCLGITSPDPVRLNLYFERFLNPARATPPDIDSDLCSRRRDEVIRYVYQRYGEDRVAMVCTINRFRARSALREVAKAYGLSSSEIKKLADSLPRRWHGPPSRGRRGGDPYGDLTSRFPSSDHKKIFKHATAILGFPHHLSIHPGGMVIAPGPITDLVPTQLASKGVVITQFDLHPIEEMGLVKIDLLGIRGLTVLNDVAAGAPRPDLGKSHTGVLEFLESIPQEDPGTSDMVVEGRTIGCFQIESPGMRGTLKEIQARSVDDIMVALALYRPGPLTGGLKDAFVRRHRGQEVATFLHPALEPLLTDTYGVILYQEQVLRIANELAGLSLADADLLRRAMSHFDPGKQMLTLKERFIAGAYSRNRVPEPVGEQIWELMAAFAGYGFPKAHAASYAQISWRAAWSKAHHPAIFLAAVLANWGGYYSQRVYLMEARRLGLSLRSPHINHARREFSVSYLEGEPVLFMGLDQVRDLTRRTQKRILRGRPFNSLGDFLARVDPRQVEAERLVKVGALEGFGSIPAVLSEINQGGWSAGQLSLFSMGEGGGDDWTLEEKVEAQEEILGVGVDAHPLELLVDQIEGAGAVTTLDAAARIGESVRIAGMRQAWRRSTTRLGDAIYIMSFEDLDGMLSVMITSDVYRRSLSEITTRGPYIVEGTVELDQERGEPFIRADRIWALVK